LRCRTLAGLWSEDEGRELDRHAVYAYVPPALLEEAARCSDAPPDRPSLVRCVQLENAVLYAHLLQTLPRERDADCLGSDSRRAEQFRRAVAALFTRPAVGELVRVDDGQAAPRRTTLAALAAKWRRKKAGCPTDWARIQTGYHAWCKVAGD